MNPEPYIINWGFELTLTIAAGVLTVLMTGLFYYVKRAHATSDSQWKAIESIQRGQAAQNILLAEINVRMENYDDLKKKQEHDHRDMSRLVDDLRHRIQNCEDGQRDLTQFCRGTHGDRVVGD